MNKTSTRTICCKLDVNGHDAALAATQRAVNQAASWIARVCWDEGTINNLTAHHRIYGETRLYRTCRSRWGDQRRGTHSTPVGRRQPAYGVTPHGIDASP
jgi:hypothetical protein